MTLVSVVFGCVCVWVVVAYAFVGIVVVINCDVGGGVVVVVGGVVVVVVVGGCIDGGVVVGCACYVME